MFTESGLTFSKCIIAVGRSDLRKGIDGICASIRLKYNKDPLEKDTIFLFCGTRKDRIKGILWTGDRFVMLYIRLAERRSSHALKELLLARSVKRPEKSFRQEKADAGKLNPK